MTWDIEFPLWYDGIDWKFVIGPSLLGSWSMQRGDVQSVDGELFGRRNGLGYGGGIAIEYIWDAEYGRYRYQVEPTLGFSSHIMLEQRSGVQAKLEQNVEQIDPSGQISVADEVSKSLTTSLTLLSIDLLFRIDLLDIDSYNEQYIGLLAGPAAAWIVDNTYEFREESVRGSTTSVKQYQTSIDSMSTFSFGLRGGIYFEYYPLRLSLLYDAGLNRLLEDTDWMTDAVQLRIDLWLYREPWHEDRDRR